MKCQFVIPGNPPTKERHRSTFMVHYFLKEALAWSRRNHIANGSFSQVVYRMVNAKGSNAFPWGRFIQQYDSKRNKEATNLIQMVALRHRQRDPVCGPIAITVRCYFPVPKSTPKWKRKWMLIREWWPTSKPDTDNVTKLIKDALNNFIYKDDAQVVRELTEKYYDINPRTEVTVEALSLPTRDTVFYDPCKQAEMLIKEK